MIGRVVKLGLVAGVIAAVVTSLPDIKRYAKMRAM